MDMEGLSVLAARADITMCSHGSSYNMAGIIAQRRQKKVKGL